MSRPTITRFKGRWYIEDADAQYRRELTYAEAAHLAADFHKAEEMRLRVMGSNPTHPQTT